MMHLHKGFLDTELLDCKEGTNNLTYQEIPGVLPVDVFVLFKIYSVLNDDLVL